MQHDFILLDRSGSMQSLWGEALHSINAYVAKLANDKVDTGVTLAAFDRDGERMSFDILRDRIIPSTWRPVTDDDATPRGMTPLNDAVGQIVSLADKGNYDKVAIIIMTDGHENSSRELSVDAAKKLLDRCRAKNWQVIFLGADFDNVTQAASYGASLSQTIHASKSRLVDTMDRTASLRAAYAMGDVAMSFTAEEREKART